MKGIINNIINFYQMQAKALGVLVANTQKALDEFEKKKKADEQAKRVESFIKDLIMDLNNMMTKFYWLKERKQRRQEKMTSNQVNAMVGFAHWVKSLTKKVQPILEHFQKTPTFAEKVDKDIKKLEAHIKAKLKKFNEILDETPDTQAIRLSRYANILSGTVRKLFTRRRFSTQKSKQLTLSKQPEEQLYNNKDEIFSLVVKSPDEELESFVCSLDVTSPGKESINQNFKRIQKCKE